MTPAQKNVLEWLANGDTGGSSETMAFWIAFDVLKNGGDNYPHDPDDFNRCLGLLDAAPDMRSHLHKMAGLSEQWAALVARWDEVESQFLSECGLNWSKSYSAHKTYALMLEVYGE